MRYDPSVYRKDLLVLVDRLTFTNGKYMNLIGLKFFGLIRKLASKGAKMESVLNITVKSPLLRPFISRNLSIDSST